MTLALSSSSVRDARADCPSGTATSLYSEAHRAFEAKRYEESIELLRRAYACESNPIYLANIARAYEEANRPKDALAAWRGYLAVIVDERDRKLTEGRISALTKLIENLDRLEEEKKSAEEAKRRAELTANQRARAAPPPPRQSVHAGAWAFMVAGAMGLVTGGVLGFLAQSKHSSAVKEPNVDKAESLQSGATDFAHAANWSFAIGGVLAGVGVTWAGISLLRSTPEQRSSATFVSVQGRF